MAGIEQSCILDIEPRDAMQRSRSPSAQSTKCDYMSRVPRIHERAGHTACNSVCWRWSAKDPNFPSRCSGIAHVNVSGHLSVLQASISGSAGWMNQYTHKATVLQILPSFEPLKVRWFASEQ